MNISTRQRFGSFVVTISGLALVAFLVVGVFRGDWHYVGSGSSNNGRWVVFSNRLAVNGYYVIPILLSGMAGAVCVLWPARKPPKLRQRL